MNSTRQHSVVGVGELLWDLLPAGPQLGGAPANSACHANQLGANGAIVSCVGDDDLGTRAIEAVEAHSVNAANIRRCSLPTGTVSVALDEHGQATYSIAENVAWDHLEWDEQIAALAETADAACFGTLGQRSEASRRTIHQFLQSMPSDALRIFDVNLRTPFFDSETILQSLELANVLKLNDEELPTIADCCKLSGSELEILQQLATRFDLRLVALTCGARGATLVDRHEFSQQQAYPADVVDTVGAGDAFTAALAVGMLQGDSLPTINDTACQIAAFVCSQAGATPQIPQELIPWHATFEAPSET